MNIRQFIRTELSHLVTINASDRRWEMPIAAALASGFPVLLGLYWGHLHEGLTGSLGGLVFLYMPHTKIAHRMLFTLVCSLGMVITFALGLMLHFFPQLMTMGIVVITTLVSMATRHKRLGPPGSLFFVMAAVIGIFSHVEATEIPFHIGILALGCAWACSIGFIYSIYILKQHSATTFKTLAQPTLDFYLLI